MKRILVQGGPFAGLVFILFLLLLNLAENDMYLFGSPDPVEPATYTRGIEHMGISREAVCGCSCEHCHHLARIESAVVQYWVVDADGWYRLFWAGDDTYYFNDISRFLTALENETWREAEGRLIVNVVYEKNCPPWEPEHECREKIPAKSRLEYRLVLDGTRPLPSGVERDPEELLRFAKWVPEARRNYETVLHGKLHSGWIEASWLLHEQTTEYAPCRCP